MVKVKKVDNLIKFKKGYDPRRNDKGRPKLEDTFSDIMRGMLSGDTIKVTWTEDGEKRTRKVKVEDGKNFNYALAATLIMEGLTGNMRAIKAIMDRVDGRPAQNINLTEAPPGAHDEFMDMDPEEKWTFLQDNMKILERHRKRINAKAIKK